MANHFLLLAATTLLLLQLSLSAPRTTADTDSDVVLDVEGNPVEWRLEHYYYIQSVGTGLPGRLRRESGPLPCPQFVVPTLFGEPVFFLPENLTEDRQIRLSSAVYIDSGFSGICAPGGGWRQIFDLRNRHFVIAASGPLSGPPSQFRIEKTQSPVGPAYKITSCNPAPPFCQDMAFLKEPNSGVTLLGLTDNPAETLNVTFVKGVWPMQHIPFKATN